MKRFITPTGYHVIVECSSNETWTIDTNDATYHWIAERFLKDHGVTWSFHKNKGFISMLLVMFAKENDLEELVEVGEYPNKRWKRKSKYLASLTRCNVAECNKPVFKIGIRMASTIGNGIGWFTFECSIDLCKNHYDIFNHGNLPISMSVKSEGVTIEQ